ncbi:MAG: BatA domain-containing protein [Bythopirellula sp.]|nr:BatA domain-containing protein [Bythopirellula sp.]
MSFLSGLFLLALPLAAVPVLIHLYRGRQRDMVYWGAMQFLEKALTKGRSWERLEEILLMLLRTAVVLALIFALARPLVSSRWWGSAGEREIVLVVDNSLSMSRTVADTSAFDQLKDNAIAFLDELASDDQVHVMLAAGGGQWLTAEGIAGDYAGINQIRSLIEGAEPSRGSADLLTCLLSVVHLDPAEKPASRRVVVFTDNQERSWQLEAEQAWKQLGETVSGAEIPTTVQIIDCGLAESRVDNLAVQAVEVSRKIARPGEEIQVRAQVANLGEQDHAAGVVEWLVDDEVVGTSALNALTPAATTEVSTSLRRKDAGTYLIRCRIEAEDQVPLDQEEGVVLEVTDEIPVLLVDNPELTDSEKSAREFLTAALGYNGEEPQPWHAVYRPTIIEPSDLAEANLTQYRAVILTDLVEGDDETIAKLHDFVREGGGLWIALGENVDRTSFNRDLFDDGDGLSPLPLESLQENDSASEEAGMIHPPGRDHPATAQLANTTQLDIDEARVSMHWQFAARGEGDPETNVLLEAGDGTPLVVENYVGNGRVIVQSFPLGLEWSNLPQLKAYVVLVSDWLDYLSAPTSARYNLAPGSALVAMLPASADADGVKLLTPAGTTVPLAGQELADAQVVRYWQTHLPGSYRVLYEDSGSSGSMPFHVARDPQESQLNFIDDLQREAIAASGVIFGTELPETQVVEESTAQQEPIWQLLLVALIVLLALELLISSWITRQRSGPALSTSV